MIDLPIYINITFIVTVILTLWLFYLATGKSRFTLIVLFLWIAIQGFVGYSGFYTVTNTLPPRFILLIGIPLFTMIILFVTKIGRQYLDNFDLKKMTILHIVRIPVEIVLYWLFLYKKVPLLMTFEGRNLDILSGITALPVFYLGFMNKKTNKTLLLLWNIICMGLLVNIVINAILSAPFEFQKYAFDQPDIAVLYFPFIWLPCCIVPVVLLSHLAAIRQLLTRVR